MLSRLAPLVVVSALLSLTVCAGGAHGEDAQNKGAPQTPAETMTVPPAMPRAKQIEPMVEPVKRAVPKQPETGGPSSRNVKGDAANGASKTRGDGSAKTSSKAGTARKGNTVKSVKLIGDRPNCDTGFKVDASGKTCVRIAASQPPRKKRR